MGETAYHGGEYERDNFSKDYEVIRLEDGKAWRELLADFEAKGRTIIKSEMNAHTSHNNSDGEVLVNRGAAPCVLILADFGDSLIQGHYVESEGDYYQMMDEIRDRNEQSKINGVYIFGQGWPNPGESTNRVFEERAAVYNHLREDHCGLRADQIRDCREEDPGISAADHIIIDTNAKKIYLLRIHKEN